MCCFRLYLHLHLHPAGSWTCFIVTFELIVNRIIRNGVVARSISSPLFFCCCIYSLCNILGDCGRLCASVISNVAYFAILRRRMPSELRTSPWRTPSLINRSSGGDKCEAASPANEQPQVEWPVRTGPFSRIPRSAATEDCCCLRQ